jgi:hypothetical protein
LDASIHIPFIYSLKIKVLSHRWAKLTQANVYKGSIFLLFIDFAFFVGVWGKNWDFVGN